MAGEDGVNIAGRLAPHQLLLRTLKKQYTYFFFFLNGEIFVTNDALRWTSKSSKALLLGKLLSLGVGRPSTKGS